MTNHDKTKVVLAHVSRPPSDADALNDAEQASCAAIYDQCIAPMADLPAKFAGVWAARKERLDAAKAADETSDDA